MNQKTRYFTSTLAVAAGGVIPQSANGELIITPHNFTYAHADDGDRSFDITGDATADYRFSYPDNDSRKPQITANPFVAGGPQQIMLPSDTTKVLPADLAVGSVVGPALYGGNSFDEAFFYLNYDQNQYGEWGGAGGGAPASGSGSDGVQPTAPPTGPVEGYIGLRIETAAGSNIWNYGYAHVEIDVPNATMKVFETGYETVVDTPVVIPAQDPKLVVPDTVSETSDGAPVNIEIAITNGGTTNPLTITAATLSGFEAANFSVSETLPLEIAPGESVDFTVSFDSGGQLGTFLATLELTSNDTYNPSVEIPLTVEVGLPDLVLPESLELGPVANDAGIQNYNLPIQNDGFGELVVHEAEFAGGPFGPLFQIGYDFEAGPLVVPAESTVNLAFTFDPTGLAAGTKTGVISLVTDDSDFPEADVEVNVEVTAPPQETAVSLAHRWSFDDLSDSAGDADAVLVGAASLSGGQLVLPGGSFRQDYASVPVSSTFAAASSMTFEGWFTPQGPPPVAQAWTKVWMFGAPGETANTTTYLDFTLFTNGNFPSASFRDGPVEVTTRDAPNPPAIPTNTQTHVAVAYDAEADLISLYVNGALADSVAWMGEINDLGITTQNHLGAAVFWNDPDFAGSINEMRIWRGVLDAGDVSASFNAGPGSLIDPNGTQVANFRITGVQVTGGNIVISGASGLTTGQTYHLQTGTTLTDFAPVPGSDFTGGDPIPTVPATGPRRFVRIATGPSGL